MTIVLRWKPSKWEKAPLMCRLFGHIWRSGWYGSRPYFRPTTSVRDNLGAEHVTLTCECNRCGERTDVGLVHDWAAHTNVSFLSMKLDRLESKRERELIEQAEKDRREAIQTIKRTNEILGLEDTT